MNHLCLITPPPDFKYTTLCPWEMVKHISHAFKIGEKTAFFMDKTNDIHKVHVLFDDERKVAVLTINEMEIGDNYKTIGEVYDDVKDYIMEDEI